MILKNRGDYLDEEHRNFVDTAHAVFSGNQTYSFSRFLFSEPHHSEDIVNGTDLWAQFIESSGYYIMRNEIALIQSCADQIVSLLPKKLGFVEFGPGPTTAVLDKTCAILQAKPDFKNYVAVDICPMYASEASTLVKQDFLDAEVNVINTDFCNDFKLPHFYPKVGLLFGGTFGNINEEPHYEKPLNSIAFLSKLRKHLGDDGYLIITQDTNQDSLSLDLAYGSDISARFRLNVMHRIARDLNPVGFDPDLFAYEGEWNSEDQYYGGYARPTEQQEFFIERKKYICRVDQRIALFRAYKFSADFFSKIVSMSGFQIINTFFDSEGKMALHLLKSI